MALSDTFTPAQFYFQIQQGQHFHLEFPPFVDVATGEAFDFTAEAWVGRLDVKSQGGAVVVSFASSGEDGVVTFGSDGSVALDLNASFTAALTPTSDFNSSPNSSPLYGDLVLTDPVDDEPWVWYVGKGQIRKQVTA